jgi:hypothetical protein
MEYAWNPPGNIVSRWHDREIESDRLPILSE